MKFKLLFHTSFLFKERDEDDPTHTELHLFFLN